MRSTTISALFALLPLIIAVPLPIRRDLLGGLDLGLLDSSNGPLDGLSDSSGGLLNLPLSSGNSDTLSPITDLTSSTPLSGNNEDGLFGLPSKLLSHGSPTNNGLLDDLLSPLTSALNPVTDVLGDLLDLSSPTNLICADVGALLLGDVVDVGICACVGLGLREGGGDGLWMGRGRDGLLEGLNVGVGLVAGLDLDGLRHKIRETGREDYYPAHVHPRCDGGGGYTCPVVYQRPDGVCGPPDAPFVPIPVPSPPTSTSATPEETPAPTSEPEVVPQSEPTPTPAPEPVSSAEPTPEPTPAPTPEPEPTSTSSAIIPEPTEVIDAGEPSTPIESYPEDEEVNIFGGDGVNRAAKPHHTPTETEGSDQLVDAAYTEAPKETETVTIFAEPEPTPTPTPSEIMTVITVPVTVNVVTVTATVTETATPTATATQTQFTTTTETIHQTDISTEHHTEYQTQTQTVHDCAPTPTPTVVVAQVAPTSSPTPAPESSTSSVAPPTSTSIPDPLIVLPPSAPICRDGEEFKQTVCCRADMFEVDGECRCSPGSSDNISLGICLDLSLCLGEILDGECIVEKLGLDTALPLGLGRINL